MQIVVDEKCFEGARDPSRKALAEYCTGSGVHLRYQDLATASRVARPEVVAIVGLGIAALALIISYLQLRQSAAKRMSRSELLEEIEAYLRLNGIEEYAFEFETGFEHIEENTGRPCVVRVRIGRRGAMALYFGATNDRVWLSAVEVDWKALT